MLWCVPFNAQRSFPFFFRQKKNYEYEDARARWECVTGVHSRRWCTRWNALGCACRNLFSLSCSGECVAFLALFEVRTLCFFLFRFPKLEKGDDSRVNLDMWNGERMHRVCVWDKRQEKKKQYSDEECSSVTCVDRRPIDHKKWNGMSFN